MTRQWQQNIIAWGGVIALLTSPVLIPLPIGAAGLGEIRQRGRLVVGVNENVRPLAFRDENGELQGLEIDLARQLAQELLGSREAVVFKAVNNRDRLPVLLAGEVDLTIARLTATPSRSRLVNFSRHYYLDGTTFITRNPQIQRLGDLVGAKIAVLEQSSTIAVVRHVLHPVELVGVSSYVEALHLLELGEVDAFAGDRTILIGWVQEHPQYHILGVRLSGEPLAVALPKGLQHSDLYIAVNNALTRWHRSGWLQERLDYWGLGDN
ncbi:transporter substrate-binding domain-containing protein [Spirulina subsalsa FACHB-351]|uniref:Transporter substrate-binding domain-containing protein n=1 Tax=Spirulina subsalsa FACHB-351 TaxID=234711 RepID=A0ABT3L2H7_9CYAN|nr:transporter substrate-binding domain-containing protein [Spirulina subsalsa]MCW6035685.1 transporter substrate-binding domain-containing protein [Spirulina subsalsa FACHB-351]